MTTLTLEADPVASDVHFEATTLTVVLVDGRTLSLPLAWYPRLSFAAPAERQNWRLLGDGYAIEWPDLDEHIGIESLLAGRRSGESEHPLQAWQKTRA